MRELQMARESRKSGNEGRARVCARRAAGLVALRYFQKLPAEKEPENGYRALEMLRERGELPAEVQQALIWLTTRVDTDHQLPDGVDLIAEAEEFIQHLGAVNS